MNSSKMKHNNILSIKVQMKNIIIYINKIIVNVVEVPMRLSLILKLNI